MFQTSFLIPVKMNSMLSVCFLLALVGTSLEQDPGSQDNQERGGKFWGSAQQEQQYQQFTQTTTMGGSDPTTLMMVRRTLLCVL